jgi:hypothetical protein
MAEAGLSEPVLKLDTLVERRVVVIDGERYEFRNPSELSVIDFYRIAKQGKQCEQMMMRAEELSEDEVMQLLRLLASMVKLVLIAPEEVYERLNQTHRLQIVQAFSGLQQVNPATSTPPAGGKDEGASTSTGESTSPGSSGSTAETP